MLKNPRVTIINLPLYYYIPNFGGIVLSAKQLRIMQSLCTGISDAYSVYKKSATSYQMKMWQERFMWYFVNWAFRKIKYLKTDQELNAARKEFAHLNKLGVFDSVPSQWYDLREKIYAFI